MKGDFNHAASSYDQNFTQTFIGKYQRNWVWKLLEKEVKPHFSILEINGGTGEDTLHLAPKVKRYHFTDLSPDMVSIAEKKCAGISSAHFQTAGFFQALAGKEKYDLIFSNFGGLNCINPQEVQELGIQIKNSLQKNGKFIAVIMGRNCKWEQRYFKRKNELEKAFRRQSKEVVYANLDGEKIPTWYYSPMEFSLLCGMKISKLKPVGYAIPPSYLNPWLEPKKILRTGLKWWDISVRSLSALANKADHYYIVLENESPA